jgi:O-antigen ligase
VKKQATKNKLIDLEANRWIFGSLILATLYFQTNITDPFNSPKSWIIFLASAWLVGYLVSFRSLITGNRELQIAAILVTIFVITALAITLFTEFKFIAFFGDTQRRNGFTSYLSLSLILLAAAAFVRTFNIRRIYLVAVFVALPSAIYAFMQTNGNDFVKWNNPYNSIIGTVGNPNFAAAVMAVMGVLIVSVAFIKSFPKYLRAVSPILGIFLLYLIYKSQAKQGLLAYILGVGVFSCIWLLGKNRKLGIAAVGAGIIVFILGVLGMLQMGPLEKYLYKPSVSVRGYYWRAGIEMLKHHPIFGVGMDSYGAFFKQYREVGYPLSYGFEITSSNAHNTFIQFFATGGLLLGVSYLALNAYIFYRAIVGLRKLTGDNKLMLAGVFSAWIAFHAQSLVSIDNIGISIWGWVLGGAIIGLSISNDQQPAEDQKQFAVNKNQINLGRISVSVVASIIPLILVALLYRGESDSFKSTIQFDKNNATLQAVFKDAQLKVINDPLNDPTYKLRSAMALVSNGFLDQGLPVVKKIYADNPRNLDALNALILISEQLNQLPDAINYREQMAKLDPWNAVNYLGLGKDYKAQGNVVKSKEMLDKILSFASANPIAEQAKTELAS